MEQPLCHNWVVAQQLQLCERVCLLEGNGEDDLHEDDLHNHRSEDIDLRQERPQPTLQGDRPAPTDLSRPQLQGHGPAPVNNPVPKQDSRSTSTNV